ncbi:MAG: alkaline phosphatase D family protein [Planctomycetales bacterium]|nr:alkaline phosphatase D family protein [Planctomycetales bacterium]
MPRRRRKLSSLDRREFLQAAAGTGAVLQLLGPLPVAAAIATSPAVHQATGVKVGEVTESSARIWTRLTKSPGRNDAGKLYPGKVKKGQRITVDVPVSEIEGACPGLKGKIRVRYGAGMSLTAREPTTEWVEVDAATDFSHQFVLPSLQPDTKYAYAVETVGDDGAVHGEFRGTFKTAPRADAASNLKFCVMTCQGYADRDGADGHPIYPAMQKLAPHFIAMTGDLVYYDSDEPRAVSEDLARLHWERMFSLPRLVECLRNSASYWLKDDHDTVTNDSWPGRKEGWLTFAAGQQIFREQVPLGDLGYRTFRWGRDLQIWLTDGRDFRSPNTDADGPEKTIWGAEQKAWFKRTVKESDATWKVLISPTPLVGPDRKNKKDNHSNEGFKHEGDEIRSWLHANVPESFFVVCGDRHWQYHSVHPETGVREFSVGPASNSHAGGTPGEDPHYHKFHRVKGGFLSVTLEGDAQQSAITFRHHDVDGAVVHEYAAKRGVT